MNPLHIMSGYIKGQRSGLRHGTGIGICLGIIVAAPSWWGLIIAAGMTAALLWSMKVDYDQTYDRLLGDYFKQEVKTRLRAQILESMEEPKNV